MFGSFVTQPKPIERSEQDQASVDAQTQQLSLYQFYACPFCVMVRREIARLGLNIETRDAQTSPYRDELAREGGQIQAPCLRIEDGEQVQWMYESADIIAYLKGRFEPA